ncbi:MAG: hypothetical protein IJK71_06750 [Clostridia bacterium]|nr:hypothetical protein [Clostridia bacterium]
MLIFMWFPMISLIFIYEYVKNYICSLAIPKLRTINQFPNIKRHSCITATNDFYTLGFIVLELLHSKIRFSMTSLIILVSYHAILYSGAQNRFRT